MVAWLLGANLVHGINATIWANNIELRVPVWCDIVTKLLVGVMIALPGALLSMSRRLELVASKRPISSEPKYQTARIMLEDHRFDLIEGIGCSAAIQPSALGLILMWGPPILFCGASLFLCAAAISHSLRMSAAVFSLHLEQRSPITSSIFIRRITISILTTCVVFLVSVFSVFTTSDFVPWTSWSAAHANFTSVDIAPLNEGSIKFRWLGVPIVSLVYIALMLVLGEETRDVFKWIRGRVTKLPRWQPRPLVLLPLFSGQNRSDYESHIRLPTPLPKPASELKSGWDDMLDDEPKKSKFWSSSPPRKSPNSLRTTSPVLSNRPASPLPSRPVTPSPSLTNTSPTMCGDDEAFMKSTMDYLGSPVAKTLGISPPSLAIPSSPVMSPILSPAPIHVSPRKATYYEPTLTPTSVRNTQEMPPPPRNVPSDVESVISSVFDATWPQPPQSRPRFPEPASRYRTANSNSVVASTDVSTTVAPSVNPSPKHVRPFEGSSITSILEIPVLSQPRSKRSQAVKGLLRTFSSEKVQDARAPVIYMHVVNEVN
ncbi:hypothetical protein H0H92_008984 [Tricholoma furcatifolium]|nr:hypothetical protein H0H92_008984 [Tricholoma furcatifolium]